MVPPRLARNMKLARYLEENAGKHLSRDRGSSWETEMVLPLDLPKIEKLVEMIARGLAYYEWSVLLPEADCVVYAGFLTADGQQLFDSYFAGQGNKTGVRNLGAGIFVYDGVQSLESPQLTLLRMSLCGAVFGGDPKVSTETVTTAYALTAPRKMPAASKLVEFLRGHGAPVPPTP